MKKKPPGVSKVKETPKLSQLPRPWNRVNLPVYSISSKNEDCSNMHIITYVTAVSMHPKRMLCAVYEGTQTLSNLLSGNSFMLQLLAEEPYGLVRLLGKESGKETDKIARLKRRKEPLEEWRGFTILSNCLALMHLEILQTFPGGDHTCFLCEVTAARNLRAGTPLTLNNLRERNIIRI